MGFHPLFSVKFLEEAEAMTDYWNDLCNDLHGVTKEGNESNLAMLWGSFNEDSALVTYLGKKQIM